MKRCEQLRPYLDGEMSLLGRWRMQRHLEVCRACSEREAAESTLRPLLAEAFESDSAAESAAIERVSRYWVETASASAGASLPVRRPVSRSWLSASMALGVAAAIVAGVLITAPTRALAAVAGAMARVSRFHVRMELPGLGTRYEGWGEKGIGTRVEEWSDGQRAAVLLDDGRKLRGYYPNEKLLRETNTRLETVFREAANFDASRMLSQAARGKLFEEQEWLGEARAREVAEVRREGRRLRKIQVDLKDGFFERMIIYADVHTDLLTRAHLYTDSRSPEETPFAVVQFDYPARLDVKLFRLAAPRGTRIRQTKEDLYPH